MKRAGLGGWWCLAAAAAGLGLAGLMGSAQEQPPGRLSRPRDPATLRVQVKTAEGQRPPGSVEIRLFLGDVLIEESICDASGRYSFGMLESGRYTVEARLPGFVSAKDEVRLRPGDRRRMTLRMGPVEKEPFDPASRAYWRRAPREVREQITKARQLRMTGQLEEAMTQLRAAIDLDPQCCIAHGEMGLCYLRLQRLEEARASLEESIACGPDALTPYLNLAELYRQSGQPAEAKEILRQAAKQHPRRAEPDYVLGRLLLDSGELEGALDAAQRALTKQTDYVPQLHLLLADIYERRGELYRVPGELQTYLEKQPAGRDAEAVPARVEKVRRELRSMKVSLDRYTDLMGRYRSGRFMDAARALAGLPEAVATRACRVYRAKGLSDSECLAAAMLHTDAALASGRQRSFHFRQATAYLEQIHDPAVRKKALRELYLAVAYHFQGERRFLVALPFAAQAARVEPEDAELQMALGTTSEAAGWIYGYPNLIERAEAVYRNLLAAEPDHEEAHLRLAHVLKLKGAVAEAGRELQWTLAHSQDEQHRFVAYLVLGDLKRSAGDLTGAIRSYRRAVEMEPDCQVAVTALSYTLDLAGDPSGSQAVLRRLVEGGGTQGAERADAWWRYLLGRSSQCDAMMAELREAVRQ